jgi:ribosomal protein S18 acetylase RimI-like enzyme
MSALAYEPSIRLRPGASADIEALLALEQAAFASDRLSRRSFRNFLASPNATLIVADCAGRLGGYALVLFRPMSTVARLYSIAVTATEAGRGIGPMLLEAAEQTAHARDSAVLRLEVHEQNAAALNRYRKSGYRLFGRHRAYYNDGGDALRFEKRLGGSSTGGKVTPSPPPSIAR